MDKVREYLEKLGLSQQEAKVYCGLLELGPTTVKLLAAKIGNQRANTHFVVESLIKKGMVYQTKEGARRRIAAEGVDKVRSLVEEAIMKTRSLEMEMPFVEKIIKDTINSQTSRKGINFKYLEGKKALLDLLRHDFCKTDEAYVIANLDNYYRIFPDISSIFRKSYDSNPKRKVYAIVLESNISHKVADGEYGNKKYPNYEQRYISIENYNNDIFNFVKFADYLFFDDSVVIVEFDHNGNPHATVIKSKSVFLSFRSLHSYMWSTLN